MGNKNYILNKEQAIQKINRMALQVAEEFINDQTPIIILGIQQAGSVIAKKIGNLIQQYLSVPVSILPLNINKQNPTEVNIDDGIDFNNKNILVCDDVANTGKTLLYSLKPLLTKNPKSISVLVLVERSHKRFPIKPDFVGLSLATTIQENIVVEIEQGEVVGAYVE